MRANGAYASSQLRQVHKPSGEHLVGLEELVDVRESRPPRVPPVPLQEVVPGSALNLRTGCRERRAVCLLCDCCARNEGSTEERNRLSGLKP